MNANLIQQAVLGSPDAWSLLLRSGAERLVGAANYQPTLTELTKNDFCEKDAREAFTPREAKALLKRVELGRYTCYLVHASRLNKKFRANLVVNFLKQFKMEKLSSKSTNEAIATLCGNVGCWLCRFKAFREGAFYFTSLFHTQRLPPKQAEEEELRVWKSGDSFERRQALEALHARNPDRARELLAKALPKAKDRETLIYALSVGLSAKDETFLEQIVAGKDENMREAAFLLLCKIPTSQRSLAMQKRAEAVLNGDVLQYDADCELAGFEKDQYPLTIGIVASLPLQYWTKKHNLSPMELCQKYPCSLENEPLYIGWFSAFLYDLVDFTLDDYYRADDVKKYIQSTPCADEWISVFLAFCKYLTGITIDPELEGERGAVVEEVLEELQSLLYECGGEVVSQVKDLAADIESKHSDESLGSHCFSRKSDSFLDYSIYEPKPWSEEYMEDYFRHIFEDRVGVCKESILFDLGFFSPEWRKKIVQMVKKNPLALRDSDWSPVSVLRLNQFVATSAEEITAAAEELYAAVEEYIACFGEFSD